MGVFSFFLRAITGYTKEKIMQSNYKDEQTQTIQRISPKTKQVEVLMFVGSTSQIPAGWSPMNQNQTQQKDRRG